VIYVLLTIVLFSPVHGHAIWIVESVRDELPVGEVFGLVDWDARIREERRDGHVVRVVYPQDVGIRIPSVIVRLAYTITDVQLTLE
jgi:hypothetical protein